MAKDYPEESLLRCLMKLGSKHFTRKLANPRYAVMSFLLDLASVFERRITPSNLLATPSQLDGHS